MKRIRKSSILFAVVLAALFLPFFLSGCQRVFTFSPFASLQRDPATLPADQQVQYAQDALSSGDPAAMAAAYDLVDSLLANDPNNGDLQLLAADLAIGASGIGDVLGALDTSSGVDNLNALLDTVDTDMLANVATHVAAAENAGATVSNSQYVNAGAALAFQAAQAAGGFDNVDWTNDPTAVQAVTYAQQGGVDLQSLLGGA